MTYLFNYSYTTKLTGQPVHGGIRARNETQVRKAFSRVALAGSLVVEKMANSTVNE